MGRHAGISLSRAQLKQLQQFMKHTKNKAEFRAAQVIILRSEGKFSCVKRKFGEYARSAKKKNMIKEARRKFVLYERMMTYAEA